MNHHEIGIAFETETALNLWLDENLQKHPDGIRRTYKGETVWAVNTRQFWDVGRYKGGPVVLETIDTWVEQ
jgi:hypothetical protein